MRVLVVNHVSLDGVLQGPGHPDEDTRDGFRHGGWVQQANDPAMGAAMGERMGQDSSWLFGRRSYDGMLTYWNKAGGSFKDGLNQTRKYVASSSPDADLPWPNSTLLSGDVPAEVAALREQPGGNLVIMGSGQLIRSLLPRGLVDELFLMIHPLVLGSGHRLFGPDDEAHRLRLVDFTPTATGVLMATYQPAQRGFLRQARRPLMPLSRAVPAPYSSRVPTGRVARQAKTSVSGRPGRPSHPASRSVIGI